MPKNESADDPLEGRWRIVSMSAWDKAFLDEEVPAFIEFEKKGGGEFHFGYIQGFMDCRLTQRDGEPIIEWTWDGNDEMESAQGRGSAAMKGGELHGMIFIHQGDESEFVAKQSKPSKLAKPR